MNRFLLLIVHYFFVVFFKKTSDNYIIKDQIRSQPQTTKGHNMYKVLNNGQLHAICEDMETAIALVKTLEQVINRALMHSPFTIELNEEAL